MPIPRQSQLAEFFKKYDPAIQRIVRRVLEVEQRYIDSLRPRVKDDIRDAIEQEARKK